MARNTPLHLKSILLIDGRHLIDAAVTRCTTYALCHMNAVIEVDKLGQVMDAFPLDRFVLTKAGSDRLKVRTIIPELAVTVHTCLWTLIRNDENAAISRHFIGCSRQVIDSPLPPVA